MIKPHPLKGPNRLKLGVFSTNADGGLAITDVPERWTAKWQDNLTAAQIADRAGLEFLLPIARWRGFGGRNRVREWSFETFTWAAALAASTEKIGLFMTLHVPLVHPLYAAKSLATVDHVSGGRAGLNIVCGSNGWQSLSVPMDRSSLSISPAATTTSRTPSAAPPVCRCRGR
jgi:alkanesulfonate monooxygenase SsuD/methylene tetrahydromethanopterin reductase-like flavin-dependent oxidoreductase (luciferase family)